MSRRCRMQLLRQQVSEQTSRIAAFLDWTEETRRMVHFQVVRTPPAIPKQEKLRLESALAAALEYEFLELHHSVFVSVAQIAKRTMKPYTVVGFFSCGASQVEIVWPGVSVLEVVQRLLGEHVSPEIFRFLRAVVMEYLELPLAEVTKAVAARNWEPLATDRAIFDGFWDVVVQHLVPGYKFADELAAAVAAAQGDLRRAAHQAIARLQERHLQ